MYFFMRNEEDKQVFAALEADPHFFPPREIKLPFLVLDLGCWIGYTTRMFAEKWPDALIIACDADRDNALLAADNCNHLPNVRVIHAAVGAPGPMVLSGTAKNCRSVYGDLLHSYEIQLISIDQMLAQQKLSEAAIGFVKMDIEGSEGDALEGEWLTRTQNILVDIHRGHELAWKLERVGFTVETVNRSSASEGALFGYR